MAAMPRRPGLRSLLRVLGRRLPQTRGVARVRGIRSQVAIGRDAWGIPHIDAHTDADAWFALGFCHGQDRAFQLEILARAGRGMLAELLGPAALPIDRLSRTLGFRRLAHAQLPVMDADLREVLDAYVAGINAAAQAGPRPHELVLLRAARTPWIAEDVLAFMGLQSLALAGNWDAELARLQILLADGPDALRAVDPRYGDWLPVTIPVGAPVGPGLDRLAGDLARLRGLVGGAGASNAWAIAPSRTATGAPILANDPHLAPAVPAPWYLAHIRTPDWELAGCSFVGGPAFPTGTNGQVAWGITAACSDSADLFWEELDLERGTARGPEGPEPVERLIEEIPVRGAAPVRHEVLVTPRGPVVNAALDGLPMALSLRATWLEPARARGFLDVHRARDFASFREAFRAWPGPALNVVYADAAGHVGWQLIGTLPRRRAGNGTLPLPAWEPGNAWEDEHLPFDALPHCLDPEEGFVASANNAPQADAVEAPFLGVDWLDGYRAARIVEAVAARDDWDIAAASALQADVTSVPWRELRPFVLDLASSDPDVTTALGLLREWDGAVAEDSAAASVFELFVCELAASRARRAAPEGWRWALGEGFGEAIPLSTFAVRTLSPMVAAFREGRVPADMVEASLAAATRTLRERFGARSGRWAWGTARPLRLLHLLGVQRPLDAIFNVGPVPMGGDANTVAQAGVRPLDPLGNPGAIPNHRTVIDLADLDRSRYAIAGGQSGNPLSRHYADQLERWRRADGIPIAWSHDAVARSVVDWLHLRPR